jgi:hypothetical protein
MSASLPSFVPFNTPDQKPVPWNESPNNTAAPTVTVTTPYKKPTTKHNYTVLILLALLGIKFLNGKR